MITLRMVRATLLIGLAWVGTGRSVSAQADVAEGARVYARTCGRCHAARSPVERSDREWAAIVLHMRVRANLTGSDARAVQAFLQASNATESGLAAAVAGEQRAQPAIELGQTVDAALVEQGRRLLEQRGCGGCHKYGGGAGGTLGPDLRGVLERRGASYVAQKLTDPRFDNPNSLMPPNSLTTDERRAIVEYLRTIT